MFINFSLQNCFHPATFSTLSLQEPEKLNVSESERLSLNQNQKGKKHFRLSNRKYFLVERNFEFV